MQLIDCFDLFYGLQGRKRTRLSALSRPAIDNRYTRIERGYERRIIAAVCAVMIDLIDVDAAHNVTRASEPVFDVPCLISAIEKREPSKRQQNANAVYVVGCIFRFRFKVLAARSNLRRIGLLAQDNSAGGQNADPERKILQPF